MRSSKKEYSICRDVDRSSSFRVGMPASLRMDQASLHDKATEGVTHENNGPLERFLQLEDVSISSTSQCYDTEGCREALGKLNG